MKNVIFIHYYYTFFIVICFNSIGQAQQSEWIKVYFNMPADTTLAFPNNTAKTQRRFN